MKDNPRMVANKFWNKEQAIYACPDYPLKI